MAVLTSSPLVPLAIQVPYVTADEAQTLLRVALERFLTLVESLEADDWHKPTACSAWNVRDIVAHQAGGYASGISYREMLRQYGRLPKKGQLPEDVINELQLRERATHSPAELIAELHEVGPIASQKWAHHFRLIKPITVPHAVGGLLSVRHLMWVIHSRDTWMHRLDICRATGRDFYQTAEHDGRIMALIMRDVGQSLRYKLGGKAVIFELRGVAGGVWQVGPGEPQATIQMDALEFSIFASGRFTYDEARVRATIHGQVSLAELALQNILILF